MVEKSSTIGSVSIQGNRGLQPIIECRRITSVHGEVDERARVTPKKVLVGTKLMHASARSDTGN
jgi:hypothetical protein